MKQIGLGIHQYLDAHKTFPVAKIEKLGNEDTKPSSWRVAILPFIGQQSLDDQYRFDEDLDSDNNLKVLKQMPEFSATIKRNPIQRKHGIWQSLDPGPSSARLRLR